MFSDSPTKYMTPSVISSENGTASVTTRVVVSTALLDHRLYLPREWVEDPIRREITRIPDEVVFRTKPQLAGDLVETARGNGLPHDWIVAFPEGDQLGGVEGHGRSGGHRLCGVYALGAQALSYLRDNPGLMTQVPVGGMPPLEAEIAQSLQTMIDDGESVLAVEAPGYHVDLDKPWHILEANRRAIEAQATALDADAIPASAGIHDGAEIRGLLEGGAPFDQATIDRVIAMVVDGGHVDRVLDEATDRMRASEKAAARIPETDLTPIIRNLDRYLLDRVDIARAQR